MEDPEDIPGPGEPGFNPDLWEECEEEEESIIIFFWKVVISLAAIALVGYFFWFLEQHKRREKDKSKKSEDEKETTQETEKSLLEDKSVENWQGDLKPAVLVSNGVTTGPSKETIDGPVKKIIENGIKVSSSEKIEEQLSPKPQPTEEEYLSKVVQNEIAGQREPLMKLEDDFKPTTEDLQAKTVENELTGQGETDLISEFRVSEQFSSQQQPSHEGLTSEVDQNVFNSHGKSKLDQSESVFNTMKSVISTEKVPNEVVEIQLNKKSEQVLAMPQPPDEDIEFKMVHELSTQNKSQFSQSEVLMEKTEDTAIHKFQPEITGEAEAHVEQKEQLPLQQAQEKVVAKGDEPVESDFTHDEEQISTVPRLSEKYTDSHGDHGISDGDSHDALTDTGIKQTTEDIVTQQYIQQDMHDEKEIRLKQEGKLSSPLQQSQEELFTKVPSENNEIHLKLDEEHLSIVPKPPQKPVDSELHGDFISPDESQAAPSNASVEQSTRNIETKHQQEMADKEETHSNETEPVSSSQQSPVEEFLTKDLQTELIAEEKSHDIDESGDNKPATENIQEKDIQIKQFQDDSHGPDDKASFEPITTVKTKLVIQPAGTASSPLTVLLKDGGFSDNLDLSTGEVELDALCKEEEPQKKIQSADAEEKTETIVLRKIETYDTQIPSDKISSTFASEESQSSSANATVKLLPESDTIRETSAPASQDGPPPVCSENQMIDDQPDHQKLKFNELAGSIVSTESILPTQTEVSEFISLKSIPTNQHVQPFESVSPLENNESLVETHSYEANEAFPEKSEIKRKSDNHINILQNQQTDSKEFGDSGLCIKTADDSGIENHVVFATVELADSNAALLPDQAGKLSPLNQETSKIMEKSAESSKTITSESLYAQADSLNGEFKEEGAIRIINQAETQMEVDVNEPLSFTEATGQLKPLQADSRSITDKTSDYAELKNEIQKDTAAGVEAGKLSSEHEPSPSEKFINKPSRPSDEFEPQAVAKKRSSTRASSDATSGSVDEMSIDRSLKKVKVTAEQKEHLDENFENIRSKIMPEAVIHVETAAPLQQQTTTNMIMTKSDERVLQEAVVENAVIEPPVQVAANLPLPPADQWEVEASVSISLPSSSVDEMPDVTTAPEIESFAERAGSVEIQEDLPNDESQASQRQAAPAFVSNTTTNRPKSLSKISRKSPQLDVDIAVTTSPSPPASPQSSPHQKVSSMLEVLGTSSLTEALMKIQTLQEVSDVMRKAGLQSSNLIFGIDYTASNKYQGENSFGGKSLHSIEAGVPNPYQQVIRIMGKTLAPFATSGYIPAFGFGDVHTSDWSVFPLKKDSHCTSFDELMDVYNRMTPKGFTQKSRYFILSGPTNFAPLILQAIDICKIMGDYHILVIVADGQVTNERATRRAIVDACRYPLSIIVVGVGDGPWDMMRVFDESLPKRPWDNFHFVEFSQIAKENEDFDLEFAIESLLEIPDQYKKIKRLGLLNRQLSPVGAHKGSFIKHVIT